MPAQSTQTISLWDQLSPAQRSGFNKARLKIQEQIQTLSPAAEAIASYLSALAKYFTDTDRVLENNDTGYSERLEHLKAEIQCITKLKEKWAELTGFHRELALGSRHTGQQRKRDLAQGLTVLEGELAKDQQTLSTVTVIVEAKTQPELIEAFCTAWVKACLGKEPNYTKILDIITFFTDEAYRSSWQGNTQEESYAEHLRRQWTQDSRITPEIKAQIIGLIPEEDITSPEVLHDVVAALKEVEKNVNAALRALLFGRNFS